MYFHAAESKTKESVPQVPFSLTFFHKMLSGNSITIDPLQLSCSNDAVSIHKGNDYGH